MIAESRAAAILEGQSVRIVSGVYRNFNDKVLATLGGRAAVCGEMKSKWLTVETAMRQLGSGAGLRFLGLSVLFATYEPYLP
jgi:hypothetical protein